MKTNFIPNSDDACLTWHDNLLAKLTPDDGLPDTSIDKLKEANTDLHAKLAHASAAQTAAKEATTAKVISRRNLEFLTRSVARQIKASPVYTEDKGMRLGIVGPDVTSKLQSAMPGLKAEDKTGGKVRLTFTKHKSDGINLYCQREGDNLSFSRYRDWTIFQALVCWI